MKRIFTLLLCLCLLPSLFACGPGEGSVTDGSDTDASGTSGSNTVVKTSNVYDPTMEHKIVVCDIAMHGIVVLDLNKCNTWSDLASEEAIVWEWDPAKISQDLYKKVGAGIDDAKLRYSPYYKTDVVIATSSGGWAGVIAYPSGELLWSQSVANGPHSIEMLPNGDVAVASSGGSNWKTKGFLYYYPLSAGTKARSDALKVPSCHGVQWDPQNEFLWVLGYDGIIAVKVTDAGTTKAKLSQVLGRGATFNGDASGHDLAPVYGQPGKYWVTAGKVWQFDSSDDSLTRTFKNSTYYNNSSVKGVASFPDGTAVMTPAGLGGKTTYDWSVLALRVIYFEMSDGKVSRVVGRSEDVTIPGREFYKVHSFCKDYQ